jgi:protein-S-isoprenylcysteine O-methyltransferase Ste14
MFVFRTIILGTIFLLLSLLVGPWIAMQFSSSFPALTPGVAAQIGAVLVVFGSAIAIYCTAILFIPGTSRPAPYDAGGTFSICGPYRFVRNPFLFGVLLVLWGEALLLSHFAMIAYAAILTWCIHFWVVFFEEPSLSDSFGDEYSKYKKAVPRWLPKFRKYKG